MNANTRLNDLETALRAKGVVDVKFFLQRCMKPLTGVYADASQVLQAVVDENFDKAPAFNDSVR